MKITKHILGFSTLIASALLVSMSGCSNDKVDELMKKIVKAPPSSIERVVVGHDQVYSVQAILRMSRRSTQKLENGDDIYTAYEVAHFDTPIPTYQEITISQDENRNTVITSDRKAFDVIKSDQFYYGLELNYFDINGNNINHQFAQISDPAESKSTKREECKRSAEATLYQHQHFFTVANSALGYKSKSGEVVGNHPLVYPMSRDSLYYDRYTFLTSSEGGFVKAKSVTEPAIYTPLKGYQPNMIKYSLPLALKAQDATHTNDYTDPAGVTYQLSALLPPEELNERAAELFTYEYRDTDPLDKMLGEEVDFDDLGDNRGFVVGGHHAPYTIRMRLHRALGGNQLERLGFKGMLRFKQSNVHFQMQVSIFHIKNAPLGDRSKLGGKYSNADELNVLPLYDFNKLKSGLGDFDSQLSIPFRVMADADGSEAQCIQDIKRYYPDANEGDLRQMLWSPEKYFNRFPSKNM